MNNYNKMCGGCDKQKCTGCEHKDHDAKHCGGCGKKGCDCGKKETEKNNKL